MQDNLQEKLRTRVLCFVQARTVPRSRVSSGGVRGGLTQPSTGMVFPAADGWLLQLC